MNQDTNNNQNVQGLNDQLDALLEEAKKINNEIDETNKSANLAVNDLANKVNDSISEVNKICVDLDKSEKEAGDELDKLILEQAEDAVSE